MILFISVAGKAQRTDINFTFGMGINRNYLKEAIQGSIYYDLDKTVGINVFLNKKNRLMVFNPGITWCFYHYEGRINKTSWVVVFQEMMGLNLDVLMKVSKRNYLRFGIFMNKMLVSGIEIANRNANQYAYYGNNYVDEGYTPAELQAGVTLGLVLPFKAINREYKFDVILQQNATPIVNSNYLAMDQNTGENVAALTTKDYPTRLMVGLEINLRKTKRPKKEDEW